MKLVLATLLLFGACGGGDDPSGCTSDSECPVHQVCDSAHGMCTTSCVIDNDCAAGQVCGAHRCVNPSELDLSAGVEDLAEVDSPSDGGVTDGTCTVNCSDASEPDNTPFYASPEPDTFDGMFTICPSGDIDMFYIRPTHNGQLQADVTRSSCGPDLVVDVIDSTGTHVIGASMSEPGGAARAVATVVQQGVYYLRVQAAAAGEVAYRLQIGNH